MSAPVISAPKARMRWPDVAKGLSIIGVVLLHVSLAVPEGMETVAANINRILDPLRMPLFFMVSGFFSAKVFGFTFRQLFLRRLWFFLVPYLLWVPIELWFKFREWQIFDGKEMPGLGTYLAHIIEGRNMYWFLYALVLFNIVLWATRKLPWWAGILVGFAPLLILPLHTDQHMIGKAVLYLPAFLLGAHFRRHIRHFAETATSLRHLTRATILYAAGFTVAAVWAWWNTVNDVLLPWPLPFAETVGYIDLRLLVNSVVQLLMLPMAVLVAVLLGRTPIVADVLAFLGRHTLVIYLGHPIALTVLYHYNMREWQLPIARGAENMLHDTALWMVAGLLISAIGSYGLWLITRVPYLRWSIMPPLVEGAYRRPASTRGEIVAATTTTSVTTR
ncbi:MAG: acyltransferase family protein [Corynebacterium sp.]|uniref:acyltransferase family protein n=1 Tax=Corynebacterium sp. TaxID=1720 RepID=UPI0026DFFD49|nr:acyltransferase family protein [Corynebacterium sp.]MDO5668805.1 acyltransferase family protein [Corynebacterium sp.]